MSQATSSPATAPMVFAVASGKGGVGKTFFSVHLALLSRMMKPRVLLIDGDLGLSNVEVAMGLHPRHHLGDVLSGARTLSDAVTLHPKSGLHILAGGAGVRELADLTPERRHLITTTLEEGFRNYDVVVIDAGAGVHPAVMFLVEMATIPVVVTTREPQSMADAYSFLKIASTTGRHRDFHMVMNQIDDDKSARDAFARLSEVVGRFLPVRLRLLGCVPDDDAVTDAGYRRRSLFDLNFTPPAARAVWTVGEQLLEAGAHAVAEPATSQVCAG
ncbi:MAG: MinD/ParA family protein [Deltaproteobacteria bacterium]|nr:MinD/ParA family protein [Planctomycetota bacterium]MBM4279550.1 MinD/ParA family protein [Deltaproteobacteria bacterium]